MHVSQHQPSSGPEPEPGADGKRSLYVPVRRGPAGSVVRLWRTPFGTRTAVAFTSDRRLRSVLGPTQPWIRLSESALRRMVEPLGALLLTVDPLLTARPPVSWSAEPAMPARTGADEATPPSPVAPAAVRAVGAPEPEPDVPGPDAPEPETAAP